MREDRCSSSPEYSLSQHIEMRKRREEANKSTLLEPTSPVSQCSSTASTARSEQSMNTTANKPPTPSRSTSPTLKAGTQTSSEELEVVYCTSPTLPKKSNPKSVQGDSSDTGTSSLSSDQDRPQSCSSNPYGLPPPPSTETIKRFIEKRFGKRSSHGHHSPNVVTEQREDRTSAQKVTVTPGEREATPTTVEPATPTTVEPATPTAVEAEGRRAVVIVRRGGAAGLISKMLQQSVQWSSLFQRGRPYHGLRGSQQKGHATAGVGNHTVKADFKST